jgi:hypothetical protein
MSNHLRRALAAAALAAAASLAGAQPPVDLQVVSATVRDSPVAGAAVTLQRAGTTVASGTSDGQGLVRFTPGVPDDAGTQVTVSKPGYAELAMRCPCDAAVLALSPAMTDLDGLRIVLDWGRAPADLDAHLAFPGHHVYFLAKQGGDARLDVDSVRGGGPETITLARRQPGVRYLYAVHDYSDKDAPATDRLARSGARVFVYVGQTLVRTYAVPAGTGNFWSVFAIGPDGELQDLDVLKGVSSRDRLQTADFQDVIDHPAARPADVGTAARSDALAANARGEAAYHAGRVDEAIAQYLQAIDLGGAQGQVYSNLGLAFQKAHRVAEAMWANRKAIALAQGPAAATVRASSHYNNGRLYESARRWDDALREYRAAQAEAANPVYDHAIARMQQQGAR